MPVVLIHDFATLVPQLIKQLPIWLLLLESFSTFLLLEVLALELLSLLLSEFNLLDFGGFFRSDSLELDSGALVAEFWDRVSQVQLDLILLVDVVKCEFNDDLSECWVFLGLLDSSWCPNNIDNLSWVSFFVGLFSNVSKR